MWSTQKSGVLNDCKNKQTYGVAGSHKMKSYCHCSVSLTGMNHPSVIHDLRIFDFCMFSCDEEN